jgi:hypothetical protein
MSGDENIFKATISHFRQQRWTERPARALSWHDQHHLVLRKVHYRDIGKVVWEVAHHLNHLQFKPTLKFATQEEANQAFEDRLREHAPAIAISAFKLNQV